MAKTTKKPEYQANLPDGHLDGVEQHHPTGPLGKEPWVP
jgi:hypothetical protein